MSNINNNFAISRGFIDAIEYFKENREDLINDWIDQDPREGWILTYDNFCERYALIGEYEADQAYEDLLALYEDDNGILREGFDFDWKAYQMNFKATIYELLKDAIKLEKK